MNNKALTLNISGTVQGIGFRPFLYQLAHKLDLKGQISNNSSGVLAYLEGEEKNLNFFINELTKNPPPHASIEEISKAWSQTRGFRDLIINKSEIKNNSIISIPPDLATCNSCFQEFNNSNNRRFNYPLISCTNCGPRYSITKDLPFDRERTSYREFPLCSECQNEYDNPRDRRHHAQTTGCANCGPNIFKTSFDVHAFLLSGKILGLKGVGGFQLICNAQDNKAIEELRKRKNRPHRPLAVMAQNLEFIKEICDITFEEEKLLTSPSSPIVILPVKNHLLPAIVSPDSDTLGVFLPTTPLHQMLFKKGINYLIVTSANKRGFPIAIESSEISSLVDGVISHNRPILSRCDDSVFLGKDLIRPGRGMAPLVISHTKSINKTILSLGADLKNTFCISKGNKSYLSPHIGDLYNYPTFLDLKKQITKFCDLLKVEPEIIAVDLHPNYFSSGLGKEMSRGLKLVEVVHHHAHALSAMKEHNLSEAYALTFDGTGYGPDGTLWGGELLHVFPGGYKRLSSLKPFLLPGGESAIKDPNRQLMARYIEMGMEVNDKLLEKICNKEINTFKTSSVGRLFDQVSALLEIQKGPVTYEGQAAIKLESAALKSRDSTLKGFNFKTTFENNLKLIDTDILLKEILFEKQNGAPIPVLAYRFHYTMTKIALKMLEDFKQLPVVFCGGVFQNQLFSSMLLNKLKGRGYKPHKFPTNDAGISIGQIIYCRQLLE